MPALPVVAAAFVAGAFAGAVLGGEWWLTSLAAAVVFLGTALWSRSRVSVFVLLAAAAFAAAGHARFEAAADRPPSALATLAGTHDVVGVIHDDPLLRGTAATVDLAVESVDGVSSEGGLRLTVPAPRTPLQADDRIAFTAELERPPEIADFDYAAYLRRRGIYAVAAYPATWDVIGHADASWATAALRGLRSWSITNIERVLPEPESSLAVGLLLGAERTMPDDLEAALRTTGTTHLVVVSGQNVALLLGTAVALLGTFMTRRRAALSVLVLLPAYVVLVGADPPVVRAAIMAVGLAVTEVSGRRTPGWVFLAYAAAIMLAFDPLLAVSVSFQLSLAATAGVLLLAPPLRDAALARLGLTDGGLTAATVEVAAISFAASLVVLPVQVATFEAIPLLQVPANVIVAPLYEAALLASVAAVTIGAIGPLPDVAGEVLRLPPATFIGVVRPLSRIPATTLEVNAPLVAGIVWYAFLVLMLWLLHRQRPPALSQNTRAGLIPTFMLAMAAGGLWLAALAPSERLASVTVLDVGQGLAVLVRDGGNAVLIDTGPPDGSVGAALSRVGQRSDIDAVVLTHDDLDHTGGLEFLRRRYEVSTVLAAPDLRGTGTQPLDISDRVRVSDRTTIEVLAPPRGTTDARERSDNNRSLVLLVTIGERKILLPADIEAPAERDLVAGDADIFSDILVVPHHGSRTSSTPEFLRAVEPDVAVVSVGASNPYGHPHRDVLGRYDTTLLLRTDLHGDVTIRTDGSRLIVHSARNAGTAEAGRAAAAGATVSPSPAAR
jgi:competence protein ComEC